ncbi:hypothetical protein [Exiguobacterium sp. s146]|uniref:hypothetical protein n=1 Tax=Exiguobacterium sp. s146 TaxID=2751223 RepID=UPI001BE6F41F|nr:hypothetical protein [Exiguobacterium sp. s146]
MFKRPIHNILTGLGMLGVLLVGWWGWYVFDGSDKAEQRAMEAAQEYVNVTYPDLSLRVADVMYLSLYDPKYHVTMASDTSVDTEFVVRITRSGQVVDDSYEEDVVSKENTYQRISEAYDTAVQQTITPTFSNRIDFMTELSDPAWRDDVAHGDAFTDLQLDQTIDLEFYGARYGILFLHAKDDSYTYDDVIALLRDVKRVADENELPFHSLKLQITIDGNERYVEGIRYSDLDSPHLLARLKQRMKD